LVQSQGPRRAPLDLVGYGDEDESETLPAGEDEA